MESLKKQDETPYLCIKDFAGFSSKTYTKGKIYAWHDIHINWQSNFSQHFELVHPKLIKPKGMSPTAFKSMVSRNNMTPESVEALRGSLKRGKK